MASLYPKTNKLLTGFGSVLFSKKPKLKHQFTANNIHRERVLGLAHSRKWKISILLIWEKMRMGDDNGVTMSPWGVYSSRDVTPDVSICFAVLTRNTYMRKLTLNYMKSHYHAKLISSINVSSHCNWISLNATISLLRACCDQSTTSIQIFWHRSGWLANEQSTEKTINIINSCGLKQCHE